MTHFFKRLGRTLADLVTSKKAIATVVGAVATAAGHPNVGAAIGAYVLAQGVADHGKEAAKATARGEAYRVDKSGRAVTP